jgi:hypothetical protein
LISGEKEGENVGRRGTYDEDQRLAWYIYKFGSSCGAFKEHPTEENFEKLKETTKEIRERLGVEPSDFLDIAEKYLANPSKELKISFNERARDLILSIMLKRIGEEKDALTGESRD